MQSVYKKKKLAFIRYLEQPVDVGLGDGVAELLRESALNNVSPYAVVLHKDLKQNLAVLRGTRTSRNFTSRAERKQIDHKRRPGQTV